MTEKRSVSLRDTVSRAIWAVPPGFAPWEAATDDAKGTIGLIADAAIRATLEAIREPDREMINAGSEAAYIMDDHAGDAYRAMIGVLIARLGSPR